tara:strand:+ start:263 stop:718 length:456 start_codon:yes stop_codon:yes gene_type:complete
MAIAKKTPTFQYGIEITKPHSKQMYNHNDNVAAEMKAIIIKAWESALDKLFNGYSKRTYMESDWAFIKEDTALVKLQKLVCYSSYGNGFTIGDVDNEIRKEVELAENWRMHELYQEMHEAGMVPAIEHEMVGFTNNYNKDYPTYATTPKTA